MPVENQPEPKPHRWKVVGLVVFLAATVWTTYQAHQAVHSEAASGESVPTELAGQAAPDFTLPLLGPVPDGSGDAKQESVALADHRGQVVFVSFWASWCRPCDFELPLLNEFYRKNRERGVTVIAVSTDSDRAAALHYARSRSYEMPMVWDEGHQVADLYKVQILPTLVVIGLDGRLHHYERGLRMDLQSWLESTARELSQGNQATATDE